MKKQLLALSCISFYASLTMAAIKPRPSVSELLVSATMEERLARIQKMGPDAYRHLRDISFDSNADLRLRWRALMTLTFLGRERSIPEIERALQSSDWFMRDAGLQALAQIAPQKAVVWSKKLLADPALVVRSTAVQSIKKLKDESSVSLLWEKLYSKENFRGSQSLWVRRQIVEALAAHPRSGDEEKFIKLLSDADQSLHSIAIAGLESLTGQSLGSPDDALSTKRSMWQSWWNTKSDTF